MSPLAAIRHERSCGMRRSARGAKGCAAGCLAFWLLAGIPTAVLHAEDWPHWRGPGRNDVVGEPSGWRDGGWQLEEAWSRNVGAGSSSPLVVAGRLYTMGWSSDREAVVCLDAVRGDELWRQAYPAPLYGRHSTGDKGIYSGVCSTPDFDAETGFLYTLGIDGQLACWDTAQAGRRVWELNLYERFGAGQRPDVGGKRGGQSRRDYGYTTSPLVLDHQLIVEVGDVTRGNLMGFDKRTGAHLWSSRNRDEAGHSGGPVPLTVEGVPCVAVLTLRHLLVVRADPNRAGETIGQFPWTTDFANNIPTPAVRGASVIVTSAYNQFAMCRVDVTLAGIQEVWRQENPSGVCSPVIHQDAVYWAWQGVHCVDFATGRQLWQGGRVGSAGSCVVTEDDRLIVWANRGDLSLVETAGRSPDGYRELASRGGVFTQDAWPHVILAAGHLYVRDRDGNMKCFRVGGGAGSR